MIARTAGGSSSTSATAASETNRSRWIAGAGSIWRELEAPPSGLLMRDSFRADTRRCVMDAPAVGLVWASPVTWSSAISMWMPSSPWGMTSAASPVWRAEVGREVAAGELVRRPPEGLRGDGGVVAGAAADVGAEVACGAAGQQDAAQDGPERLWIDVDADRGRDGSGDRVGLLGGQAALLDREGASRRRRRRRRQGRGAGRAGRCG